MSSDATLRPADAGRVLDEAVHIMRSCGISYREAREELEKRWLLEELREFKGNQCKAARALHMHRNTLSRQLHLFGIEDAPRQIARVTRKQARASNRAETATAVNSVRKGGRGESPEPSAEVQPTRSSGFTSADELPDPGRKLSASERLVRDQLAMRRRWEAS